MFSDRLKTKLSLTIGSSSFELPAGSVQRFTVELWPWGFDAEVQFVVDSSQEPDTLFPAFSGVEVVSATFTFSRAVEGDTGDSASFKIVGWGTGKSVSETVGVGQKGAPVVVRLYTLRFEDAARVFWTEHRPVELHAGASMEQVLKLHEPTGVDLACDWSVLQEKQDVLCLSLHGESPASFYDFIVWYIDRNQGVFELDARTPKYRLGGRKAKAKAVTPLDPLDVEQVRLRFPEPPRFAGRILNPFAEAPTTKDLANANAVAGVRRDVIVSSPIAALVDRRAQVETARFRPRSQEVEIVYKRCPDAISQPNDAISIGDGFSDAILPSGNTYRVVRLRAEGAHGKGETCVPEDELAVYDLEMSVQAEDANSAVAWLPPFTNPRRIVRLEGKIVSSGGGENDRTWAAVESDRDSLWTYKVHVPLFNKTIPAPFAPTFVSGHFFFPAYKNQRVLVDVDWDSARIAGFLDWADEARVPSASQGDQIVLGFKSANGTIIKHDYEDAKPILQIVRKNEGETSTFKMADGTLRIALDESAVPSTAVPVFDVTPQVDAAKDEVTGEVGGAVGGLTAQFQTTVGQVSGQIDETTGAVDAEIGAAEKTLKGDLLAVDAELQSLAADASAAIMSVDNAVNASKAKLTNALAGLGDVKRPLRELDRRVATFCENVELQAGAIEKDVMQLGAGAERLLDRAAAATPQLRARIEGGLARLRTDLEQLGPRAGAGAFAEVAHLRSDVDSLRASVRQLASDVEADVGKTVTALSNDWGAIESELASRKGALASKADALIAGAAARAASLSAKLDAAVAARGSRAASAQAAVLRPGIDGIVPGARAAVGPTRDRLASSLDAWLEQAKAGRARAHAAVRSAGEAAAEQGASLSAGADALVASLDRLIGALESAAATEVSALTARVEGAESSANLALARVQDASDAARATLTGAVETARRALASVVSPIRSIAGTLGTSARAPLATALAAIDAAEQTMRAEVDAALAKLGSAQKTAHDTLQGFIDSFLSIVATATTSIDALKDVIAGLRAQIEPPLDALGELVTQIETAFQAGANVLTAFIDTASATLDAIPAVALPKAAVAPAVKAIQGALSAVLPLISQAAEQAGAQLSTLATKLLSQVDAVEKGALAGISTFSETIHGQLQAILPPAKQQLATVQAQIDAAVEAVENQLAALTEAAVTSITTALQAAAAQASAASKTAEAMLGEAQSQLDERIGAARSQLASRQAALESEADKLVKRVEAQLATVSGAFDGAVSQVEQAIEAAKTGLRARLEAGRSAVTPEVARIQASLAEARSALATALAAVRAQNQAAVARARASVPAQAALDAELDEAWAAYAPRLDALEAALGQL